MSYDELELDRTGDRKTATFFIISDTDTTYNFIVALAFSQMFNLLCERADNVHGGRLPHHVRVLWDEAANTGQVPQLEKLCAVIRSREISSDILVKLAKTFHVSTDYILGLTTVRAPKSYDISELRLSEGTVKALVSDSVDVQILNRIIEHKRFPYLMLLIKKYFDDESVAGIMGRNEVIDFATATLGDFAKENPEHKADVRDDIRYLKSEKLGEHEADLEKIKSTFMAIIKDIKSECTEKKESAPIATADFMRGVWEQLQDKPRAEVTEEDVSAAVMNMVGKTAKLDGKSADLFQKIITRVLKNSRK